MKSPLIIKVIAILQAVFVVCYFSYMLYIAVAWGFNPRIVQLLVTDSIYVFLLVSSVGIWFYKPWGWWVTIILYGKLLLSKVIGSGSEWFLIFTGTIAEPWRWEMFAADFFIVILFLLLLGYFFRRTVRSEFCIKETTRRVVVIASMGVILLYALYFVIALWLIIQMG
ncbi:hypothetical protein [Alteribacter populi]|uniref:hypothetical protein n=1 Tax=Alteribacter populi TaxID=2011011 RepID=UPI000BBAD5B8|nr:hypothetical protein [Alteribacter populi]